MNRAQHKWMKPLGRIIGTLGVLLLVLSVRVVSASHAELREGDQLRARHEIDFAIAHYRRAARQYAPLNPYSVDALDRLSEIARTAEQEGDRERALAAWRSVRGAILASRSFYIPEPERLSEANEHIATLMSELPPPAIDAARSPEERRAAEHARLDVIQDPALGFRLLALVGLATWIVAAWGFVTRAIDEDDRIIGASARIWGTAWITGFGAFILGLALA
jgi:hypothetical protein